MQLHKASAIPAGSQASRLESQTDGELPNAETHVQPLTQEEPPMPRMKRPGSNAQPVEETRWRTVETDASPQSAIAQAEALRDSLRDALLKANDLIGALKRQRRQTKLVQSTLASLKQLQSVAG